MKYSIVDIDRGVILDGQCGIRPVAMYTWSSLRGDRAGPWALVDIAREWAALGSGQL